MTVRYSKAFAKTASPMMDTFKSVITNPNFVIPTAAPLAAMAIGVGANKIRDVVSDAIEARNKAEAYKAMIAAHPVLKAKPERDVRAIYNSVYNINPGMAKDPLVAGALLDRIYSRQAGYGGHEGTSNQGLLETVQELSKIRSDLAGAASNEHKVQNRFDFARPAETVVGNMLGAYSDIQKDVGELGSLTCSGRQMHSARRPAAWIPQLQTRIRSGCWPRLPMIPRSAPTRTAPWPTPRRYAAGTTHRGPVPASRSTRTSGSPGRTVPQQVSPPGWSAFGAKKPSASARTSREPHEVRAFRWRGRRGIPRRDADSRATRAGSWSAARSPRLHPDPEA